MSSTTCKKCGQEHEIVDSSEVFGDEATRYVTYTCPDGDTTYGVVVAESAISE